MNKKIVFGTIAGAGALVVAGIAAPAMADDTRVTNSPSETSLDTPVVVAPEIGTGDILGGGVLGGGLLNGSAVASGNEVSGNDVSAPVLSGNDTPVLSGNDTSVEAPIGNGSGNGNSVGAEVSDIVDNTLDTSVSDLVDGTLDSSVSDLVDVDGMIDDITGAVDLDSILGD